MIIIAGASGGLGSYLCDALGKDHAIIGTYHTHKPETSSRAIEFYQVDVTDSRSIDRCFAAMSDRLEQITMVNLAGVSLDGMGHKMSDETWDRVVDTNLKGTFMMCRAVLPLMRDQGWGRIINISSVVGQMGVPGTVAYSASKAGLFGLTRTLATENAAKNITANVLALGYFEVGIIDAIKPELQELIKGKIPMKRFGHPRNVDQAIRFLIESDYITGSVLNINGGLL